MYKYEGMTIDDILENPDIDIDSAEAHYALAQCYKDEESDQCDFDAYKEHLLIASSLGSAEASSELLELTASDSKKNEAISLKDELNDDANKIGKLMEIADKGDPSACLKIYSFCKKINDEKKAEEYLSLCLDNLDSIQNQDEKIHICLSLSDVYESTDEVHFREMLEYARELGSSEAIYRLISVYENGIGGEIKKDQATECRKRIVSVGSVSQKYAVAQDYLSTGNMFDAVVVLENILSSDQCEDSIRLKTELKMALINKDSTLNPKPYVDFFNKGDVDEDLYYSVMGMWTSGLWELDGSLARELYDKVEGDIEKQKKIYGIVCQKNIQMPFSEEEKKRLVADSLNKRLPFLSEHFSIADFEFLMGKQNIPINSADDLIAIIQRCKDNDADSLYRLGIYLGISSSIDFLCDGAKVCKEAEDILTLVAIEGNWMVSVKFLEKAADLGDDAAKMIVTQVYCNLGEYQRALNIVLPIARTGNKYAQLFTGYIYLDIGDKEAATGWLLPIVGDFPEAEYGLYRAGHGTDPEIHMRNAIEADVSPAILKKISTSILSLIKKDIIDAYIQAKEYYKRLEYMDDYGDAVGVIKAAVLYRILSTRKDYLFLQRGFSCEKEIEEVLGNLNTISIYSPHAYNKFTASYYFNIIENCAFGRKVYNYCDISEDVKSKVMKEWKLSSNMTETEVFSAFIGFLNQIIHRPICGRCLPRIIANNLQISDYYDKAERLLESGEAQECFVRPDKEFAYSLFLAAFSEKDPSRLSKYVYSVLEIGIDRNEKTVTQALLSLIEDEDACFRKDVVFALIKLGEPTSNWIYIREYFDEDESSERRIIGIDFLKYQAQNGNREATERLLSIFPFPDTNQDVNNDILCIYQWACRLGMNEALLSLGRYYTDLNVGKSFYTARDYFDKAIAQGCEEAKYERARLFVLHGNEKTRDNGWDILSKGKQNQYCREIIRELKKAKVINPKKLKRRKKIIEITISIVFLILILVIPIVLFSNLSAKKKYLFAALDLFLFIPSCIGIAIEIAKEIWNKIRDK